MERIREEKLVSIETLKKDLQERMRVKDAEHQRNLEQVLTPSSNYQLGYNWLPCASEFPLPYGYRGA